jgi:hypothetical protein
MNRDVLVQAIVSLAAFMPIVTSIALKAFFTANGTPHGWPHGWPIRDAEDEEFMQGNPRIVKWRIGAGLRGLVGYTVAGNETAEAEALQRGYTRLRG